MSRGLHVASVSFFPDGVNPDRYVNSGKTPQEELYGLNDKHVVLPYPFHSCSSTICPSYPISDPCLYMQSGSGVQARQDSGTMVVDTFGLVFIARSTIECHSDHWETWHYDNTYWQMGRVHSLAPPCNKLKNTQFNISDLYITLVNFKSHKWS